MAVEMGLYTKLGNRRLTGEELGRELGLHPRGIYDFFDAQVAMGFLEREGDGLRLLVTSVKVGIERSFVAMLVVVRGWGL